jgi:protein-S-isoprenylcysteine O-methyltransferase Ste14
MVSTFIAQNRIAISRLFWIGALIALLLTEKMFADRLIGNLLPMAGLVLIGIAMVGRLWCSLYIGGRKNNELVTEGPYSMTRNPLYFFSLLGFVGIAFCTRSISFSVCVVAFFVLVYPSVIASEEALLRGRFGAAFEAYCKRTPRFFPSVARYRASEMCEVSIRQFGRTARDVIWFVWLGGIVALIEVLRPTLVQPLLAIP